MTERDQALFLEIHIEAVKEIIQSEFEMLKSETERPFDEKELMKKAVGINRIQYINFIEELTGKKWEDLA